MRPNKATILYIIKYGIRCESYGHRRGSTGALALLPMCGPLAARGSERSGAHRLEAVLEAKTWLRLYIQAHGRFVK